MKTSKCRGFADVEDAVADAISKLPLEEFLISCEIEATGIRFCISKRALVTMSDEEILEELRRRMDLPHWGKQALTQWRLHFGSCPSKKEQ